MKNKKKLALLGCGGALLLASLAINKNYSKNNEVEKIHHYEDYPQVVVEKNISNEINELNLIISQQEKIVNEKNELLNEKNELINELLSTQADLGSRLDSCLFHSKYYINDIGEVYTKTIYPITK
jgi:hypothetical protein